MGSKVKGPRIAGMPVVNMVKIPQMVSAGPYMCHISRGAQNHQGGLQNHTHLISPWNLRECRLEKFVERAKNTKTMSIFLKTFFRFLNFGKNSLKKNSKVKEIF